MPTIEKHVGTSLKRTGKKYLEVHQWIDDPEKKNERHDITAIPDNFQMFIPQGHKFRLSRQAAQPRFKEKYREEAAWEYVQQLSDDLKGRFGHVLEDFEKKMAAAIAYFAAK